jgi:RNA polymerase sigma factor (sigma-70 family)
MPDGPLGNVLRHIRRMAATPEATGLDDAQLLDRFLAQRDEAAFEVLLRRHGPMVYGVCRRVLRDPHETDDAFQATFLVLIRKARSLSKRELVANWLYGVAYRTALKARTNAARRRTRQEAMTDVPGPAMEDEVLWRDLRPVLDEELHRLPAKYRIPVVLCYLEGKTFTEAAQELGWPAGTVSGRLARARELLRTRLTRRGVTLSAGLVGTVLSQNASATVPAPLLTASLVAAIHVAARHAESAAGISLSVATLMEGVLRAMFWTRVKIATAVLLALGVLSTGAGVVTYQKLAAQQPDPKKAQIQKAVAVGQTEEKPQDDEGDALLKDLILPADKVTAMLATSKESDKLKSLLKERYEAASEVVDARFREFLAGRGTLDILIQSSHRLFDAERELSAKKADQIAAAEKRLRLLKAVEEVNKGRYDDGRISIQDYAQSKYNRLEAEIWLERAKAK